jgi:hypothetical protein
MNSAYAQAYPKTVDSAFNTHWYDQLNTQVL